MENIKISNFRKIKDEWSLDLAPVTFFTGTNNSGKSTIFKALMLLEDYVKSNNHFQLDFNANNLRKHKVDSYSNAFNRFNTSESNKDLKFAYSNREHRISLIFTPNEYDYRKVIKAGKLKRLEVIRDSDGSSFVIENTFANDYRLKLDTSFMDDGSSVNIIELKEETNRIKKEIEKSIANASAELNRIEEEKQAEQDENEYKDHLAEIEHEKNGTKNEFSLWLKRNTSKNSGTANSYLKALEILNIKNDYNIYKENDIKKITLLYKDVLIEQKIEGGKYYDESAPSYGEAGFYSAALKKYIDYLNYLITPSKEPFVISRGVLEELTFNSRKEIELSNKIKDLKKRLNVLKSKEKNINQPKKKKTVLMPEFSLDEFHGGILKIDTIIRKVLPRYLKNNEKSLGRSSEKNEIEKAVVFGDDILQVLQFSIDHLSPHRNIQTKVYINSHNETDINEVINAHSLNEISKGGKAAKFIKKWMVEFDIGQDFEIDQIAGLVSQIKIKEGGQNIDLADKGFGAGQIFTILLKIALIIDLKENDIRTVQKGLRRQGFDEFSNLILIEEPEANLHPALQSKLADLFYEVNSEFGIRFIIETHSEYLIRQSQYLNVVNSSKNKDEELFGLFYFQKKGSPYQMKYLVNGKFDQPFGKGFFNEADDLAVKTYKANLKKK